MSTRCSKLSANLDDHTVRKIMTTRLDLVAVPEDAPLADAIAVVQESGYSRLPVYQGSG